MRLTPQILRVQTADHDTVFPFGTTGASGYVSLLPSAFTLPANRLRVGSVIRIRHHGRVDNQGLHDCDLAVFIGGVKVASRYWSGNDQTAPFTLNYLGTLQTIGATADIQSNLRFTAQSSHPRIDAPSTPSTIDTTSPLTIDLKAEPRSFISTEFTLTTRQCILGVSA